MDPNMSPEEATLFAVSQVVQPSALKPSQYLGVVITLVAVVGVMVVMRLTSNYGHAGRVFFDDYLSIVALVFLVLNAVEFYVLLSVLNSDPRNVSVNKITTLCAIGIFAGNCAMYTAKLPLLFLYHRTFGIKKWLRWTCLTLAVLGGLGFLATATYTTVGCSPDLHETEIPPLFLISCITHVTNGTISRASISIAMDVIMFFLPLPIIKTLNLPFRRKLGLALVFMTGLLAIAASALGLYYQTAQSGGSSDNFANALLVTVTESAIVILVSCAPALHLFWTKQAGALRQKLGLTRLSTQNSSRNGNSKGRSRKQENFSSFSNGSTMERGGSIQVKTYRYIELDDMPQPTRQATTETRVTAPGNYR